MIYQNIKCIYIGLINCIIIIKILIYLKYLESYSGEQKYMDGLSIKNFMHKKYYIRIKTWRETEWKYVLREEKELYK
jgi:hypothetical protein